ncbi:MAG TPA: hypothetical protein VGQ35_17035, partial [Dongiaceae bacterium]|nr:hypothetical protein [Dongiaceae bacterium]
RPQSIPVFLLIKTAFQILWLQRDDALRLGFIPTLICFGGLLYGAPAMKQAGALYQASITNPLPADIAFGILSTLLIVLVAMALAIANWLRFMLLGPMGAVGVGLAIGRPHARFLVWCVILGFAGSIAFSVLSMPMLLLPQLLAWIGLVAVAIVLFVLGARLTPFLIGQVIAQPMSLQQAWNASRGNGIALASALILADIPLWIGARLLVQVLSAIGFADLAPMAMIFIMAAFQIAAGFVQAGILAAAFRQIVGIRV